MKGGKNSTRALSGPHPTTAELVLRGETDRGDLKWREEAEGPNNHWAFNFLNKHWSHKSRD